jgi:hypothetical protein
MDQAELYGRVIKVNQAKPQKQAGEKLGSRTAVWEQVSFFPSVFFAVFLFWFGFQMLGLVLLRYGSFCDCSCFSPPFLSLISTTTYTYSLLHPNHLTDNPHQEGYAAKHNVSEEDRMAVEDGGASNNKPVDPMQGLEGLDQADPKLA